MLAWAAWLRRGAALGAAAAAAGAAAAVAECASASIARRSLIRCGGDEMQLTKNYESMDEVGKGGFGVVCRARNRTSGIVRAIKRLDNTDFFL